MVQRVAGTFGLSFLSLNDLKRVSVDFIVHDSQKTNIKKKIVNHRPRILSL